MEPTVSVIIPTYNRAHLLPRALESVLAQTFTDFEVLVVDDGSTDGTAALLAAYEARDGRVRYLVQPHNAGVSAARNRGLREARGAFVAFLDSDDEWFPQKLERQVARFEALPERVGLLYTGVESVFEDGSTRVDLPRHRGDVYKDQLCVNVIHGGGSNAMLRKSTVQRVGYFDEEIPAREDYDYWLRVTKHFEVDFVPEPLIRYHDPEGVERKSLHVGENLAAREWLYQKHADELSRAGVAHLFLLKSARQHLAAGDVRGAVGRASRAVLRKPLAYEAYPFLLEVVLPRQIYRLLRKGRGIARLHQDRRRTEADAASRPSATDSMETMTDPRL